MVTADRTTGRRIYHLARRPEWEAAVDGGRPYRRSTLGRSLDEEGFIHCSFLDQVEAVAHLLYGGRDDVVLLTIDTTRLTADVRVEGVEGTDQRFPHVYGPLPLDAVVEVDPVPLGEDGRLAVRAVLPDL